MTLIFAAWAAAGPAAVKASTAAASESARRKRLRIGCIACLPLRALLEEEFAYRAVEVIRPFDVRQVPRSTNDRSAAVRDRRRERLRCGRWGGDIAAAGQHERRGHDPANVGTLVSFAQKRASAGVPNCRHATHRGDDRLASKRIARLEFFAEPSIRG